MTETVQSRAASALKALVVSREGYEFDPESDRWRLSRDIVISLAWTRRELSSSLAASFRAALPHYAIVSSAAHTCNISDRFRAFAKWSNTQDGVLQKISPQLLISYRSTLTRDHEWYLRVISIFLRTWFDLGISGVDSDVLSLLKGLTLRRNVQGRAVQIKCPHKGQLSDLEYEALQERLLAAYQRDEIGLGDFVLVLLFMATGRRPAQLADLKGGDLIEARSSDGLREFVLNFPRRKQRGGGWRTEFKPVALTPEIGLALRGLILHNESVLGSLCSTLPHDMRKQLPIFPKWRHIQEMHARAPGSLSSAILTEEFHVRTGTLSSHLESTVASLSVPSERTGGSIRIFPTRLRRTLGSRAAREGYGKLIIAELLDHTDDQSVYIYTENVPEHIDAINEAMARQLAPLAQAFAGVLVDHEHDAIRGGDQTSRVRTEIGHGAGTCGHFGFCGAYQPIACYTCVFFQAWLDGAHEEVLQSLLIERDRIRKITSDPTMASINDRTIYAVTLVIQRCEARRAELDTARHLV
jgi:integrase